MAKNLGRRIPKDFVHVERFPFSAMQPTIPDHAEDVLPLPYYHKSLNQGSTNACVGFSLSLMLSIINTKQAIDLLDRPYCRRYEAKWLWEESKEHDEWEDTARGDNEGTSVRAGCDVLRTLGHVRAKKKMPDRDEGISENRWATTVDEVRASIVERVPLVIGMNWYAGFDHPKLIGNEYWIGKTPFGALRGGHAICIYGASDRRQAVKLHNSWGKSWPMVWLSYENLQRLIQEDGEICLVTDRL